MSDLVYAQNYGQGVRWLPGKIVKMLGTTMFEVQLGNGKKVCRHADQLRSRTNSEFTPPVVEEAEIDDPYDARIPRLNDSEPSVNQSKTTSPDSAEPPNPNDSISDNPSMQKSDSADTPHEASENDTVVEQDSSQIELLRSSRVRNPSDRYRQ